ncbi:hypothetical protein CRUP_025145 [Coryphaenoides rupestris]|nr:hypothetical protein CRUP_025145 [Coryphaenoides rupestris]
MNPVFLKIQQIPDSGEKNDNKLYFFFREKSLDSVGGASPSVVARVGRVCLVKRRGRPEVAGEPLDHLPEARLICSVIGDDGVETAFDELRDVFIQPTQDERNPVVYALFTTAGSVFKGSAVCVYSMADIRNVFNGPFAHKHGHNYQWTEYTGKIPYPRPGTCPGGTFTPGIRSSKDFSDDAVNFMRAHPLMFHAVYPLHRRPLVVRSGVDYRYTAMVVDQVDAVDGRYEVLFLGTDQGTVQKVIVLPKDPTNLEELTLEEVEVFRQQLYVSSDAGLTQVSLHRCGVRSRRQDVKHGDPLRQCRGFNAKGDRAGGVLRTSNGILLKSLNQSDAGQYHCLATENGFKHTVARVSLRVLDRDIVLALTSRDPEDTQGVPHPQQHPQARSHPSDAATPFPPEIRLINQYCQSYWEQLSSQQPQRQQPRQQTRKRTSRRHTESQEKGLG